MKSLGLLLTVVAFSAAAAEPLPAPQIASLATASPALYSFHDVYRLTVGAAPVGLPLPQAESEGPVRVAVVETQAAALEPRFTVRSLPVPERWLLALAGLLLAGWVAHRRLSYL